MGRVEPFTVYLLFLVLHPPEEVPSTEQWFTKRFSRIISSEVHIPPYLQEILLPHTLMRKPSILCKVPTEVTTIQNLCQQQPPTLLIYWHYHLILSQSKHLMKHKHYRPCELPQSQILQFSLYHIQSSRGRRICSESRTDRSNRRT